MRKYIVLFLIVFSVSACDKHDPILPGVRTSIFDSDTSQNVLNIDVPELPENIPAKTITECKYTIDNTNTIRDGDKKIFVGYPAPNFVDIKTHPLCDGNYVYAGLNTGNVVKVSPSSHKVIWMTDVYSESNMTGGATTVDIVSPLVMDGSYIYAGGMGNAFCKININSGDKKWCSSIGTRVPFIVLPRVAFVVGMDNTLYAVRTSDGAIYWYSQLKEQNTPIYNNKIINVGKQKFNAINGELLK